jgi:DNA-binding MarR family transcriptional regulator
MNENIINQLGALAVGARMRRLTEMFARDVSRIYKEHGLDFDPKHFILFYLIAERGSIGIMEVAEELGFSHPAIIHIAKELEKKGFIESMKSLTDNRKRLLKLSEKGARALPEFKKLWGKIDKLNTELMATQQYHLLKAIAEMEAILEDRSFYKRFNKL